MPATIAAHAPLPHARVSPAPRSNTRRSRTLRIDDLKKADVHALGKGVGRLQCRTHAVHGRLVDIVHHDDRVGIAHGDRRERDRFVVERQPVAQSFFRGQIGSERDAGRCATRHIHLDAHPAVLEHGAYACARQPYRARGPVSW